MNSLVGMLAGWHNFYLLLGTSAATLIGLMFVAVTFGATLVPLENASATRAFLDPTVSHFVQVLLTAGLVLVPTIEPGLFAGALIAIGVLRGIALVWVFRGLHFAHRKSGDLEMSDWVSGVVIPLAVYVGLISCGIAMFAGHTILNALAILMIVVLLNGVYGAWELMLWLAIMRARAAES